MKVIHLISGGDTGGAKTHVLSLLQKLNEQITAQLVCFREGRPDKASYRRFRIKTVEGQNDFAMMNEVVKRYFSRLLREQRPLPDLLMVDGGKGQLHLALDALISIDCPPFPVVGLAKRNEEIFLPGRSEPVVLDRNRPALKVLQALRDEAHRFGITHHRNRRSKGQVHSAFDDIKGIGEKTRDVLLRHFKSLKRVREASLDDIAAVVGPAKARIVYDGLREEIVETK